MQMATKLRMQLKELEDTIHAAPIQPAQSSACTCLSQGKQGQHISGAEPCCRIAGSDV